MDIFTIGFTQKTAKEFFDILKKNGIECLVDIRLRPSGQLAGFTKQADLRFFLKELNNCDYFHLPELAPTDELLSAYRKDKNWAKYEINYLRLLKDRHVIDNSNLLILKEKRACLLCSEPTADKCHRRLFAEFLSTHWCDVNIIHL